MSQVHLLKLINLSLNPSCNFIGIHIRKEQKNMNKTKSLNSDMMTTKKR